MRLPNLKSLAGAIALAAIIATCQGCSGSKVPFKLAYGQRPVVGFEADLGVAAVGAYLGGRIGPKRTASAPEINLESSK